MTRGLTDHVCVTHQQRNVWEKERKGGIERGREGDKERVMRGEKQR